MAQRVRKRLLGLAAAAFVLGALLVFGDVYGWWTMLADDNDNGLLKVLDRGDKIGGMVSCLAAVVAVVVPVIQGRRGQVASGGQKMAAVRTRRVVDLFVDRRRESLRLWWALTDPRTPSIVMSVYVPLTSSDARDGTVIS